MVSALRLDIVDNLTRLRCFQVTSNVLDFCLYGTLIGELC